MLSQPMLDKINVIKNTKLSLMSKPLGEPFMIEEFNFSRFFEVANMRYSFAMIQVIYFKLGTRAGKFSIYALENEDHEREIRKTGDL